MRSLRLNELRDSPMAADQDCGCAVAATPSTTFEARVCGFYEGKTRPP